MRSGSRETGFGPRGTGLWEADGMGLEDSLVQTIVMVLADEVLTTLLRLDSVSSMLECQIIC